MPIPILLTLVGRVAVVKIAQFAIRKGLPQAIKKFGKEAVEKAGKWAIRNPKDVGLKIITKTKTISTKVKPKFHLSKSGKVVKRGTEKIEVGKRGAKSVKTVLKKKEKIIGRVGKRGTVVKRQDHKIAKVKKTTSTITLGGKTIGKVSSTSQPVRGYRHKPVKGLESKIRHETLGNKIFRLGFKKRFKVKGRRIK